MGCTTHGHNSVTPTSRSAHTCDDPATTPPTRGTLVRHTTTLTATMLLAAALTACGSSGGGSSDSTPTGHAGQSTKAGPAKDAAAAWAVIHAAVPTSRYSMTITAANDDNHLLGRPGQYTSAVKFADTRVNKSDAEGSDKGDVDWGGGVECFADHGDAQNRADYIGAIVKKLPMLSEYDYLAGRCLVRVSHYLTPDQAADYKNAAAKIG